MRALLLQCKHFTIARVCERRWTITIALRGFDFLHAVETQEPLVELRHCGAPTYITEQPLFIILDPVNGALSLE